MTTKLYLNVPFKNSQGKVISDYDYKVFTEKDGYVSYSEYTHFVDCNRSCLITRNKISYDLASRIINCLKYERGYVENLG